MRKLTDRVAQRLIREVQLLSQHGSLDLDVVRSDALLKHVKSNATFFSDFDTLAAMGVADRVPGGLSRQARQIYEGTYFGRNYSDAGHRQEREAIAALVTDNLVNDYETAVVGHGTTCLSVTQSMFQKHIGVMVITTNVAVAELAPRQSMIVIGGIFEWDIWALCGPEAQQQLAKAFETRKPHFGLVGASGVSISRELDDIVLYCHKPIEKSILGMISEKSPRLIVVVGRDKIGKSDIEAFWSMRQRPRLSQTVLVTTEPPEDDGPRREAFERLERTFKRLGQKFLLQRAAPT